MHFSKFFLYWFWIVIGVTVFISDNYSFAQCPSTVPDRSDYGTGNFSIKKVNTSCIPVTVLLKSTLPGSTNIKNVFDYRGGAIHPDSLTTDSIYTYSKPGIYTILQFSEINGRKLITCPKVYVPDTIPPQVRLITCGGTSASIEFDRQTFEFYSYSIDWGDGNVQEILPYIKKVSHTYASSKECTIKVWGEQNDSCRSNDAILQFIPTTVVEKPVINEFKVLDSRTAQLTVSNPLRTQVLLLRKNQQGGWESTGRTLNQEKETLQVTLDSLTTVCYRVEAIDSCLATSYQSEEACTASLLLKGLPLQNELSWTSTSGNSSSRRFILKDGMAWKDISGMGNNGSIQDNELVCGTKHCYQLVVETGNTNFLALPVCRNTPALVCGDLVRLHVPDAFSPNNDGINDVFEIKGNLFSDFQLIIYNAWGSVIFQTSDPSVSWDGNQNGSPLPSDTYIYSIRLTDPNSGFPYSQNGSVRIIR